MRFPILIVSTLLWHQLAFAGNYVQPESDGRSYFAVTMGNALEEHRKVHNDSEASFTISPAAVQKMIALLYNAVEDSDKDLLDIMLLEMGLKYFDETRLMELATHELTTFEVLKEEQLDKLDKPIKRADVLEYFKLDFNELGHQISFENFLIAPQSVGFKNEFKSFAKEFFNATLEYDNKLGELEEVYRKFDRSPVKLNLKSMDLFSVLDFKAKWKSSFVESNAVLETRGDFNYAEITSSEDHHLAVQVLELPLESNAELNILLITPKHGKDLSFTTNYEVVRPFTDPESSSSVLKRHHMHIKVPKIFNFQTKTDLMPYFGKNGLTNAGIFRKEQPLCRMFSYTTCLGMPNSINQYVSIQLEANIVKELPTHHSGFLQSLKDKIIDFTQTETFDISEKPFLFIVKSKKVIYFMGHYYGENL